MEEHKREVVQATARPDDELRFTVKAVVGVGDAGLVIMNM